MGFIRIKKRKKNNVIYRYAYEVENYWDKDKESPRQKNKEYLGKVLRLTKVKSFAFFDYFKIENKDDFLSKNTIPKIMELVIELELAKHGFQIDGRQRVLEGINYDPERKEVRFRKRKVVLEMNDGFFCDLNLKNLFSHNLENNVHSAKEFAKLLVEAGLDMDKDVFVGLFSKIQEQSKVGFEEFKDKVGY